jgi:GTP-binding protein EngB required for normal cell division
VPSGRPVLILATKSDKLNTSDRRSAVLKMRHALAAQFPAHADSIAIETFSATTFTGVDGANRTLDAWLPKA